MTTNSLKETLKKHVIPEADMEEMDAEELGRGAYGVVIRVKYKGNLVAGKRMHSMLLETEKFEERFKEECMRYAG